MAGMNDPMAGRTRRHEESLARVLEAWPIVRAAWLFGSVATGSAGPLSDVDVAVHGCSDRRFFCRDSEGADGWEDFALRRYFGTAGLRRILCEHMQRDFGKAGSRAKGSEPDS